MAAPRTDNTLAPDAAEIAEPLFVTPRRAEPHWCDPAPAPAAAETPNAPVTPTTAAPHRRAAHLTPLLNPTAAESAPERAAVTAEDDDDPYDRPRANSTADAQEANDSNDHDAAHNSAAAPVAFDEIARRRAPISDKIHRRNGMAEE